MSMRLVARLIKLTCRAIAVLAPSVLWLAAAVAQPWPSRPITLLVAFPPGSISDYVARVIAHDLSSTLGQTVIVENKPGGGGAIATVAVAKAPADGYDLLMTAIGPAVLRPLIDSKLQYDTVADFTPIILIGDTPNVFVTSPTSRFGNVRDIVAYASQNPGKLTIGHPGPGTMGHLAALLFATEAHISANFISYQGSASIVSDLVGGHIDVGSIAYGGSASAARLLAVTTDERPSFLPDIPTMRESNLPNVSASTWHAIFAPAGLAPEAVSMLNKALNALLDKPEVRNQFSKIGYRVLGGPPERLRQRIIDDRAKWSAVIQAAHITINP
jgi:tripartite-type tricarboxylate transporter receptor subunit TctC